MTPHFTRAEFEFSLNATRLGISNTVPAGLMPAALETLQMLERIRADLSIQAGRDVPILITSGYRCQALNQATPKSSKTSDHILACAADWKAPAFGTPYDVAKFLAPRVQFLGIGQLIHEFGAWVHTSTRPTSKQINRIITISQAGTSAGIVRA